MLIYLVLKGVFYHMLRFKVADFYCNAVLSMLFNNKITHALVEGNDDRQVYDLTTNDG
jgi:hypothetical protein